MSLSRPHLRKWSGVVHQANQILLYPRRRRRCRSWKRLLQLLRPLPFEISQTSHFGGSNCLSFLRRHVRVSFLAVRLSPRANSTAATTPAPRDWTTNHLRRPQLKDFGHAKVRHSIDAQIKRLDLRHISIGRLCDQVTAEGSGQSRHTNKELMLKDLIGRPSILSRLRVMDILPVGKNLTLSAVEGPGKDDFMFTAPTVRSRETLC